MTKTQQAAMMPGLGGVALIVGVALASSRHDSMMALPSLPFVLIATGFVLLLSGGALIRRDQLQSQPARSDAFAIEREDERNRMIAATAKASGFDFAVVALPATILALGILRGSIEVIVVYIVMVLVALMARARISREI